MEGVIMLAAFLGRAAFAQFCWFLAVLHAKHFRLLSSFLSIRPGKRIKLMLKYIVWT